MPVTERNQELSLALIALLKGVVYGDADPALWQSLLNLQSRARDYLSVIGLDLILDEGEGFAFLRQKSSREGEPDLPRLIRRRQFSYPISLLLALIRKKLAESDALSGDTRLILSEEEIVDMVRNFFLEGSNAAKLTDRVSGHVSTLVDLGFLRRLKGTEERFEVGRILKTFVDAHWLQEFETHLAEYRKMGEESTAQETEVA